MVFLMNKLALVNPIRVEEEEAEFLYLNTLEGDTIDSKAQIIGDYFQHSKKIQLTVKSHFMLEPVKTILTILGADMPKHFNSVFTVSYLNDRKQLQQLNIAVTNVTSMKFNRRTQTGFVSCLLSLQQ